MSIAILEGGVAVGTVRHARLDQIAVLSARRTAGSRGAGMIDILTVEPMPVAAVRRRVTAATFLQEYIKAPLWDQAEKRGLRIVGHTVIVYHDGPGRLGLQQPGGIEADLGILVAEPFEGDLLLQCVMTPAGRAAHARHNGHYAPLPVIHADIRAWCEAEGHAITGSAGSITCTGTRSRAGGSRTSTTCWLDLSHGRVLKAG